MVIPKKMPSSKWWWKFKEGSVDKLAKFPSKTLPNCRRERPQGPYGIFQTFLCFICAS